MQTVKRKARPNILFIVADDLNAWIGALGRHPDVKTPAIDQLCNQGTLFTHAYCSAPYCNASRMGVFTGCLPSTTGIYSNEPLWDRPGRHKTFVEMLRDAGYYTFGAGKVFHGVFDYATAGRNKARSANWREIENRPHLWDTFVAFEREPLPANRPLNRMFDFDRFEELDPRNYHFDWGPLPDDDVAAMPDERVYSAISEFLEGSPPKPFFCAAGLYKPHLPWHAPGRFFDLYPSEKITLPFVKADDLDDVPAIARAWAMSPPDHDVIQAHGQWREAVQGYLACISYCDSVIARIIAALDRSGLAEDTIVVLWGDNGFHLGEKLHWRKFVLWEEATRVPMVIVPPAKWGLFRPRISSPVSLIDLFPTLLDLIGLVWPQNIDGESLLPVMDLSAIERSHPVVTTWEKGNHSIRAGQWRYTRYHDASEELYDQDADPFEWNNLIGDPRFEGTRADLRCHLPIDHPAG